MAYAQELIQNPQRMVREVEQWRQRGREEWKQITENLQHCIHELNENCAVEDRNVVFELCALAVQHQRNELWLKISKKLDVDLPVMTDT